MNSFACWRKDPNPDPDPGGKNTSLVFFLLFKDHGSNPNLVGSLTTHIRNIDLIVPSVTDLWCISRKPDPGSDFFHPGFRVKKIPYPGSESTTLIVPSSLACRIWDGQWERWQSRSRPSCKPEKREQSVLKRNKIARKMVCGLTNKTIFNFLFENWRH